MAWPSKEESKKKNLIKEGKELGCNLNMDMSLYELEHRVAEAKEANKPKPQTQKSGTRGEY